MFLIELLIVFIVLLLSYQIFIYLTNSKRMKQLIGGKIIEGMESTEYSDYNTNNPDNALILSQQNAGNISYLKQQVDDLSTMKTTVDDLKEQINLLNTQVQGVVQQQADFAQQIAGNTPPEVTGTD
jgi:methyl-accepting chemotaxis protein